MSAGDAVIHILLGVGLLVAVASAVVAVAVRDVRVRLHLLTPVTSVTGPLVGLALAVQNGWSAATAQILVVVALLAVTGPVLQSATGRLLTAEDGGAGAPDPEPGR